MSQTPKISKPIGASKLARPTALLQNRSSPTPSLSRTPVPALDRQGQSTPPVDDFKIGDRVWVAGAKPGIIAFIGEVQFGAGEWAGVVLDSPVGKNNGSVNGIHYFVCEPKRGIFSRLTKLSRTPMPKSSSPDSMSSDKVSTTTTEDSQPATASPNVGNNVRSAAEPSPSVQKTGVHAMPSALPTPRRMSVSSHSSQEHGSPAGGSIVDIPSSSNPVSSSSDVKLNFKVGDRVLVSGSKAGIIRYLGEADFAKGIWVGVELDVPLGKNDGSVAGKRYFQCTAMHGLFAPFHKVELFTGVSRPHHLPSERRSSVNKFGEGGFMSNQDRGSQESISSIGSAASSASRSGRMRLGINALGSQGSRVRNTAHSSTPTMSALQKTLKEKDEHIEQLIRERDIDRTEFIRTAAMIDEVESKMSTVLNDKTKLVRDYEEKLRRAKAVTDKLEADKSDLKHQLLEEKRKVEDLQFTIEEATIDKGDIQTQAERDANRLKLLETKLKDEMNRCEKLEKELKNLRGAGKAPVNNVIDESVDDYLDQIEELTHKLCVAENQLKAMKVEDKVTGVELCRNCKQGINIGDSGSKMADSSTVSSDAESSSLSSQLKSITLEKTSLEIQFKQVDERLKQAVSERQLVESKLAELAIEFEKVVAEKDRLVRERLANQNILQETGVQIKKFEQQVERMASEYSTKMDDLRNKAEMAEAEGIELQKTIQELLPYKAEVTELKKQIQATSSENETLRAEVNRLKTSVLDRKQMEATQATFKSQIEDVQNQHIKFIKDLEREKELLQASMESTSQIMREKDSVIVELQKEIYRLQDEQKVSKSPVIPQISEQETKLLQQRVKQLEKMLSESQTNANIISNHTNSDPVVAKLKSDKDTADSQVEFLNSVIVELQRKNVELETRLQAFDPARSMTDSMKEERRTNGSRTKLAAPRLFCDICDVFDLHDTDDCPKQDMSSSPPASQYHGNRKDDRPYCNICEVFGHTAEQCNEEQMF